MTRTLPFASREIQNPPPPRLPASGQVTARANETATAASAALPPCLRISIPIRAAVSSAAATAPPTPCWTCGPAAASGRLARRRANGIRNRRRTIRVILWLGTDDPATAPTATSDCRLHEFPGTTESIAVIERLCDAPRSRRHLPRRHAAARPPTQSPGRRSGLSGTATESRHLNRGVCPRTGPTPGDAAVSGAFTL